MIRFQPDSWLQGLMRPLIMLDPAAGTYFELSAPDLRPTLLFLLLPLALLWGHLRRWPVLQAWRLPVALLAVLYLWTFVIGNGRYFLPGLLASGPLLLWTIRAMPGTAPLRVTVAAVVLVLQAGLVWTNYNAGQWSVAEWRRGPGLPLPPHPLRGQPAVFLTLAAISHSLLVPQFHPQSRWSNIAGQRDVLPGTPEFERLRAMLTSPLPQYVVAPVLWSLADEQDRPTAVIQRTFNRTLAPFQLMTRPEACTMLRTHLRLTGLNPEDPRSRGLLAYWICRLEPGVAPDLTETPHEAQHETPLEDVFQRIEAKCPRLFPPNGGQLRRHANLHLRHYTSTDMTLMVVEGEGVAYKHYKALNPTFVGSIDEVRAGRALPDCNHVPGRYIAPWNRD